MQPSNLLDTRRTLNVHKTFRRCPERLVNNLCTFNLRPHCAKIVQMRSFLWTVFSLFGLNTEIYRVKIRTRKISENTGKYGPEKTPYLDCFHAVPVSRRYALEI